MFNYLNELNVEIEKGEEVNLHNETMISDERRSRSRRARRRAKLT